jgi:hypothetical protein
MKKEEIYVKISTHDEQKRAIDILQKAGEKIGDMGLSGYYCILDFNNEDWDIIGSDNIKGKIKITLDQLEQLLTTSIDKEIESFKERMKERGFEISVVIEKEIIKPDDVVMCYDLDDFKMFAKYKDIRQCWKNVVKVTDEHVLKFLNL